MRRYQLDPRIDPTETEFLRNHLEALGWEPTADDDWHLNWSAAVQPLRVFRRLDGDRRVNHYPGIGPMFYKDEFAHFLGPECGFHPQTFSMPHERQALLAAMTAEPDAMWLRKPKRLMAGIDIVLVGSLEEVPEDEPWIVQRYVADPLLLPGRPNKHVLRVFVLVTSLDPLVAYVHDNGVVKITSRPYDRENPDPVVHLTNPRVQRTNTDVPDPVRAMDFEQYRAVVADADIVLARISAALAKTMEALRRPVRDLSSKWADRLDCCFELLGFDVLVDESRQPWVLECNISPALGVRGREGSPDRAAQHRGKGPMVGDMLAVLGAHLPEFRDGREWHPEGGFRPL